MLHPDHINRIKKYIAGPTEAIYIGEGVPPWTPTDEDARPLGGQRIEIAIGQNPKPVADSDPIDNAMATVRLYTQAAQAAGIGSYFCEVRAPSVGFYYSIAKGPQPSGWRFI